MAARAAPSDSSRDSNAVGSRTVNRGLIGASPAVLDEPTKVWGTLAHAAGCTPSRLRGSDAARTANSLLTRSANRNFQAGGAAPDGAPVQPPALRKAWSGTDRHIVQQHPLPRPKANHCIVLGHSSQTVGGRRLAAWKAGWVHALTSSNLVSSATLITSQLLKRGGAVEDTTHLVRLGRVIALAEVAFAHDHEPMPFEHWSRCQAGKGGHCR
jgi:hypothetical protein